MSLTAEELIRIDGFILTAGGDARKAAMLAFEDGKISGALQAAQRLGANLLAAQNPVQPTGGDDGDEDAPDSPLTAFDRINLQRLGINPDQCFRQKNSAFKIVGYKPSRWKYPVSMVNQNGRKLKCAISFLKQCRPV